jgi:hypothetical protein
VAASVSQARGANAFTSLEVELSTDNIHWSRSIQVLPGTLVNARVVAGYEGRASLFGLAWVNFQPVVRNWDGPADQILPYVATGNQTSGQVAYDKPQAHQAGYGRIAPFAAISMGSSGGGFDTTLITHVVSPPDQLVTWHNRLYVSNKKLKFMSKIQKYKDRGFNLSISDVSFNRNVCLDCAEANARRVISHRKVDRSDRIKGKYWSCDTSGPYDPSIVKKNIYKKLI